MRPELLGQPCRNFQILGLTRCTDPRDGREKVVLANFAAGGTGTLIFVDPRTGAGEQLELPGDNGAWALLDWRDERLLVGTCATYGYLHDLDLRTRTFAEPQRDPDETYIWNLCAGTDGKVYGGTYPGCVLLQFDPVARQLRNLGRVSDDAGNLYSRAVYSLPGRLLIACGTAAPHLAIWDLASGRWQRFGEPGDAVHHVGEEVFCLMRGGQRVFYDSRSLQPLAGDHSDRLAPPPASSRYPGTQWAVRLGDGRAFVVRGQEYYLDDGGDAPPRLLPIPARPPATHILTIAADAHGRIWGSSGFGQTIFRFDPATGESWNSPVVTFSSGEVYGIAPVGERLFLACYSGGNHVVYDPRLPWNQLDNVNPRTLAAVGPALIRPAAKSVVGPDGHVWTGWMARYGVYGGGLSRVATDTLEVSSWSDPVPEQAIAGLAADDRHLYFVTSGSANGLRDREVPLHFVVFSPKGSIVWQHRFAPGQRLGPLAATGGLVTLAVDQRLVVFSPAVWEFVDTVALPAACQCLVPAWPGCLAAFCGDELWRVEPQTGRKEFGCRLPGRVYTAAMTPDGVLYCAIGASLYRIGEETER